MQISIITPSYNQLDWLRLCVASVADQGGKAGKCGNVGALESGGENAHSTLNPQPSTLTIEHIIQDAGTDGIRRILNDGFQLLNEAGEKTDVLNSKSNIQHSEFESSLRVFSEKDSGMYDAINRGLSRATGEVCAYLNCDEQYLPGTLRRVSEYFRDHPKTDVLFGDAILVSEGGEPLSYRRTVLPTILHTRLAHLNTLTCSTFFRRKVIEEGFLFKPEWKAIGDAVWVAGLMTAGFKMTLLPEPLAVFTWTGTNLGGTKAARMESNRWRGTASWWQRKMTLPVIAAHRVRKFRAGAYCRRNIDIAVYTHSSHLDRRQFIVKDLGFGWPNPAG